MANTKQHGTGNLTSKPHIAVVGAGMAGLRCADILLQHGFQVTIIEARKRVGGRLHQEILPNGHVADVGPNWIHGTDDNPLLDLVKQTDTVVSESDSISCLFDESGKLFSHKEGKRYAETAWEILEDAFEYSSSHSQSIDCKESLYDFFLRKVEEEVPAIGSNYERKRQILMQLFETWGTYVGTSAHRQSLKFFWLEECINDENLFCAGTFQKVLEKVAKPAVEGAEVKFQTKVNKIVCRMNPEEKTKVQTQGGETLEFDEVVLTAPLGWLKRNLDAFEPALPARMTKAINAIGYGCLEKVYINFPKPFWLGSEKNDRKAKALVQWLSPNYVPDLNPKRWNQEAMELASLAPEVSHPTLLFYTIDEQSKHITGELSKMKEQEQKDEFLRNFFQPYYSRLPHYSESNPDCNPSGFFATEWLQDEFAGFGSYSNFQVGLMEGDADIETMRQGLPDRGLWLAGEHTAPLDDLATAHGAYLSGQSVAKRIAEAYSQVK